MSPKCFGRVTAALLFIATSAMAQQTQIIKVPQGQSADLWFGVNVTGKVYVQIATRDGMNRMKLWWVKWGIGATEDLGSRGPISALEIPIAWWKGLVSAKLRGVATSDTVVRISDRIEIDKSFTFRW